MATRKVARRRSTSPARRRRRTTTAAPRRRRRSMSAPFSKAVVKREGMGLVMAAIGGAVATFVQRMPLVQDIDNNIVKNTVPLALGAVTAMVLKQPQIGMGMAGVSGQLYTQALKLADGGYPSNYEMQIRPKPVMELADNGSGQYALSELGYPSLSDDIYASNYANF